MDLSEHVSGPKDCFFSLLSGNRILTRADEPHACSTCVSGAGKNLAAYEEARGHSCNKPDE
jgi:hypothetical protein